MGEKETDSAGAAERGVIKTKTKSNQSNDRMDAGAESGEGGITHEDDWHDDSAKLAPERPVKSEIAIGDPGVNGNLAVGEPGVGAATPTNSN